MPTVELRFSPLPENVRTARLLAATLARRSGLDEAVVDEVKLAVGEACIRAVQVHRAHAPDEPVMVSFSDEAKSFGVVVHDCGPYGADTAIDPTGGQVPAVPDLVDVDTLVQPSAIGPLLPPGFGLAIVAGLVDDLVVDSGGAGTDVRMVWPRAN